MLKPRVIPCLLVHNKGLVKTVKFKDSKYVGDPLNAVKIFNEKEADELVVLDIDATVEGREPDYKMIENLAAECRMPLCYGGGVKTVEQAQKILNLGVEKIALSSAIVNNTELVKNIAKEVGSQSVVAIIDVKKKTFGGYSVFTHNGTKKCSVKLGDYIKDLQENGVGEIVINSIDNDGSLQGYDFKLIEGIKPLIKTPLTILGGAKDLNNIQEAIETFGVIGCAAGSIFVFKGKYKAVLINYPNREDKYKLFGDKL
jgi:cyclase